MALCSWAFAHRSLGKASLPAQTQVHVNSQSHSCSLWVQPFKKKVSNITLAGSTQDHESLVLPAPGWGSMPPLILRWGPFLLPPKPLSRRLWKLPTALELEPPMVILFTSGSWLDSIPKPLTKIPLLPREAFPSLGFVFAVYLVFSFFCCSCFVLLLFVFLYYVYVLGCVVCTCMWRP